MPDYKKLVQKILSASNKLINEAILYPEGMNERMNPSLEEDLRTQHHSLGKHPAFPEGDEDSFEQKIMGQRFNEVCKRYKRSFGVDEIDNQQAIQDMMPLVFQTMALEVKHKKALEKLAVKMIREEYDMDEDTVEIIAELTPDIDMEGTKAEAKPVQMEDLEFETHDDIENANAEVYKRRFLNAMTQGAAKKCNHMFHMADDELTELDPKLPNKYAKMMSAADYMFFIIPKMDEGTTGGIVRVEFPSEKNPKAVIHAQAMVFPVLIHEIVKGVMELLSAHGLPQDKKLSEFVIDKADSLKDEVWDMRLGPAIWSKFTDAIDEDDFHLKHHIYSELAALPAKEFHREMKEIMAGTKRGKKIIKDIVDNVKRELQEDEFNHAMREVDGDEENEDGDIDRFF